MNTTKQRYGTYCYALSKLYLMMEKQHNRGQEGAGIGVVKLHAEPGHEYVFRERALGSGAIQQIFDTIRPALDASGVESLPPQQVEREVPFVGEIYMGHLRYSTTGKKRNIIRPSIPETQQLAPRNLLLCGNFNMTNVDRIFSDVVSTGQHPRIYSDTIVLLEQLGHALDHANHEVYRAARQRLQGIELTHHIEDNIDIPEVLRAASPHGTADLSSAAPPGRATCSPCATRPEYARHSTTPTTRLWSWPPNAPSYRR